MVIARDTGGYPSGLTRWRQGDVAGWVGWVADTVSRSADQVGELVTTVEDLQRRWEGALTGIRADAAARRLLDLVPRHPALTAPMVADLLGVSGPTARAAVEVLAAKGILEPLEVRPIRPGRPARWWMAGELVSAVSRWSR